MGLADMRRRSPPPTSSMTATKRTASTASARQRVDFIQGYCGRKGRLRSISSIRDARYRVGFLGDRNVATQAAPSQSGASSLPSPPGTELEGWQRVAYRPGDTDPLEIMIARQRAWRRGLLIALLLGIVRLLWRADLRQIALVASLIVPPASTTAAPPSVPVAKVDKLTAAQVEQQLRVAPLSSGAPRNQYCLPGEKGWDYVCAYSAANPAAVRMKIGVRVGPTEIVEASMPHPVYGALPPATGH